MEHGTYFKVGHNFIAFRAIDENKWRMSRLTANHDMTFTLTLVGEFEYTRQMREFVEANPDAGK